MTSVSSDPLIGRRLDGRYQVRSRIARGGMATVYLASDERLERLVAVKVMHGHLADDEGYRARFIQEARSAARLAHPNVVNVYDQGQDGETAYLVMEYLPGITLRELLTDHGSLTTEQAFDVMEAILSGLAAAHRSGIVHRDLKPENVLLADDGRIKISDFGLARAATASTSTGNALLGTIAYLSPELVTRGLADARSDIYAAGIMLYEMVTGEQPYKGDQPFQIAHQHVTDTVPAPSSIDPTVPSGIDELVRWATSREPEHRPDDAGVMLARLLEVERALGADDGEPLQRTMVLPMAVGDTAELPPHSTGETQVLTPIARPAPAAAAGPVADLSRRSDRRRRRLPWLVLIVLLLAATAIGLGWYFGAGPGSKTTIPLVEGRDVASATSLLEQHGLVVSEEITAAHSPTVAVDAVMGTDPPVGESVPQGSEVTLVISLGPAPLPIPELVGLTEAEAITQIEEARFTLGDTRRVFSTTTADGIVVQALGIDDIDLLTLESYGEQQPVTLVVSRGPIPNVSGQTVDEAIATLEEVGLTGISSTEEYHDSIPTGDVIRAQPQNGATMVSENGEVDLIISKGVEPVEVPDVAGKTWGEAKPLLLERGFELDYTLLFDGFPGSTVVQTVPGPGSLVAPGSTVRVTLQLQL